MDANYLIPRSGWKSISRYWIHIRTSRRIRSMNYEVDIKFAHGISYTL
jgi:hypothetical protein